MREKNQKENRNRKYSSYKTNTLMEKVWDSQENENDASMNSDIPSNDLYYRILIKKTADRKRIGAFEMYTWRKMLRILQTTSQY